MFLFFFWRCRALSAPLWGHPGRLFLPPSLFVPRGGNKGKKRKQKPSFLLFLLGRWTLVDRALFFVVYATKHAKIQTNTQRSRRIA